MASQGQVKIPVVRLVGDGVTDASDGSPTLAPVIEDQLGRSEFADHILGLIVNAEQSFTLAVYGNWGEGKTHLLKSIQQRIDGDSQQEHRPAVQGFRTVWFDSWRHQRDVNLLLAMLHTACELVKDDKARFQRAKGLVGRLSKTLLLTGGKALASVALEKFAGLSGIAVSVQDISAAYKQANDDQLSAAMALQEEQTKLQTLFHDVLKELAGDGKIVFFIDDLDRCLPPQVVQLLEQIKLFMDHEKCIFVIGVDEKAVVQAIQHEGNYDNPGIAGHYLEKMVQYAFDLPPVAPEKRKDYIRSLLKQTITGTESVNERIDQIVELWLLAFDDPEVDASVRLIKRTVNTFSVDCSLGLSRLGGDFNPLIMAVLSVVRTCYRGAFDYLRRRPETRKQELWQQLFEYPGDDEFLKFLGTVFSRSRTTRRDYEGHREPQEESQEEPREGARDHLGYAFVQACQNLKYTKVNDTEVVTINQDFPDLVEAHFRLASPDSVTADEPPRRGAVDDGPEGETNVAMAATAELVLATSSEERAVLRPPIETLERLPGLVDYFIRRPSDEAAVESVVKEITSELKNDGSPPEVVRLSGIDWRVLKLSGDDGDMSWPGKPNESLTEVLLLADRVVGTGPYNKARVGITWERCDLRHWLNGSFLESLGEPLGARIIRRSLVNEPNPTWGTPGGEGTADKVFLLSMKQAVGYLAGDWNFDWEKLKKKWLRDAPLSAPSEDGKGAWWWLRSPGGNSDYAALVHSLGPVHVYGTYVSAAAGGVRPAFRLNLESERR